MSVSNTTLLDSTRITRIIQDQATRYQNTLPLRFLDRLIQVNADDDEILMTLTSKNIMADVVADDQAAAVYGSVSLELSTNTIPNIKSGIRLSQNVLNRLGRIADNLGSTSDAAYFNNFEAVTAQTNLRNIRERANFFACGMMLDSIVYNKNGVIMSGGFGMPSALKVTPSTLWTSTSATPITDILTMKQTAANTYGENYNRVTLSTADLLNAFATTEFKSQVASLSQIAAPLPAAAFNARDGRNTAFFSALINMVVETEDKTGTIENPDGTTTASRIMPLGKVLFSDTADDKNSSAWDFANAVVTESVVAKLTGNPFNFPTGEQYGPIAFYTPKADLNPPTVVNWAVQRGFPRKFRKTATAVLTVQ